MAGKSYLSKPTHRYLGGERETTPNSDAFGVELEEADVWNSHALQHQQQEFKKQIPSSRFAKKSTKRGLEGADRALAAASSLPVNIPDWSKILREERRDLRGREFEGDSDDDGEEMWIPPHEFLAKQVARNRIASASFSVHEGIGRTLKGRDLSRVRNAIWQQTGFED